MRILFLCLLMTVGGMAPTMAYAIKTPCSAKDKPCMMADLERQIPRIEKQSWRDKAYRELAKSYTYEGMESNAIALIEKIETPDTRAMTIRGIGMAAADSRWRDKERYNNLFVTLAAEADKIEHAPSKAIAYTYIAMSQAFAGDDDGAHITAKGMENDALRNKAFAETAEIQAERGDFEWAMRSIAEIDSEAFANKAYAIIAHIFIKEGKLTQAYQASMLITNPYKRVEVNQAILNYGNKEEMLP